MKTGTPNFFPLNHSSIEQELFHRLTAMGMRGSDAVYTFDVDAVGMAGRYRLEYSRLQGQWGYYAFLDDNPILNSIERKDYAAHRYAEELMDEIVRIWIINRTAREYEKVHHIVADVASTLGKVQLLSSGVVLIDLETVNDLDRDLSSRGGPGGLDVQEKIANVLKGYFPEGTTEFDVKFYRE